MEPILGIDLGTSNSSAAILRAGKPVTIPSHEGAPASGKAFPSVVAFLRSGETLVGEMARRQAAANPEGTITAFKRKMGTDHKYRVQGKQYSPQQIAAMLLEKIKRDAEAHLGEHVGKAVITVPAYFNDRQRTATKQAGELAGLEIVRIINEPTAASLAYGLDKPGQHRIMVFDLGGGTLDVTILELGGGVFEVKSTSGDTQLGGTDMDQAITEFIIQDFQTRTGITLHDSSLNLAKVREVAEKAKIELSTATEAQVTVPFISEKNNEPIHLNLTLTRVKLEELAGPIVERCRVPLMRALSDAKLTAEDIDHVILVGGPTRMPIVRRFVDGILQKPPEEGIDPMEVVAMGAAIQGAVLSGEMRDLLLLDVTPLSLGIETFGGLMNVIIPRNTTIPTKAGEMFTTAVDNQSRILIHVLQGEREMAADNFSLGRFSIDVEPAAAGMPRIGVQFTIDENGILHVLARDIRTGAEKNVTVKSAVDISGKEVEKMVQESVEHALEDMLKRQLVEAKLSAEQVLNATLKALEQYSNQLTREETEAIDKAIRELKAAVESQDPNRIKDATQNLDKSTQHLAQLMLEEVAKQAVEEEAKKLSS
ncbi:MAG: molecular chaperone DnaK [Candidatus Bathyarchaeia archaeon]